MSKSSAETKLLETIDADSPTAIRRQVAEIARRAISADIAIFCRYALDDQETLQWTVEVVGGDRLAETLHGELRERVGRTLGDWDRLPSTFASQLGTIRHTPEETSEEAGGHLGKVFRRAGIREEASVLLYDGVDCLGWLGVFRVRDGPITEADVETLDGLVESAKNALVKAETRETSLYRNPPAQFLFNPTRKEIEYRSANARMWLDERRGEQIMVAFDELDARDFVSDEFVVDGFAIRTVLLSGESGIRVLASIEQLPLPTEQPESVLTPRQREVAMCAADGATNREIAEALEITPDTVSDHLSEAYERLEVANRVELTRKMLDPT